jgi:hypothetical protein
MLRLASEVTRALTEEAASLRTLCPKKRGVGVADHCAGTGTMAEMRQPSGVRIANSLINQTRISGFLENPIREPPLPGAMATRRRMVASRWVTKSIGLMSQGEGTAIPNR